MCISLQNELVDQPPVYLHEQHQYLRDFSIDCAAHGVHVLRVLSRTRAHDHAFRGESLGHYELP